MPVLSCVVDAHPPIHTHMHTQNGSWDEVSGEAFLRKLLSMPIEEAKFNTVSVCHTRAPLSSAAGVALSATAPPAAAHQHQPRSSSCHRAPEPRLSPQLLTLCFALLAPTCIIIIICCCCCRRPTPQGRESLFDNGSTCGVDPRSIAQRIMDIRTQLSEEFIQELQAIAEENSMLLRWVWRVGSWWSCAVLCCAVRTAASCALCAQLVWGLSPGWRCVCV